jgi:hypothetical protein
VLSDLSGRLVSVSSGVRRRSLCRELGEGSGRGRGYCGRPSRRDNLHRSGRRCIVREQRHGTDADGERTDGQEDEGASAQPAREEPAGEEIGPRWCCHAAVETGDVLGPWRCAIGRGESHGARSRDASAAHPCQPRPAAAFLESLVDVSQHSGIWHRIPTGSCQKQRRKFLPAQAPYSTHRTSPTPSPATEKRPTHEDPPKCPNRDPRVGSFQLRSTGSGESGTAGRSTPAAAPSSAGRFPAGRLFFGNVR